MSTPIQLHRGQKIVASDTHRFRVCCNGRRWGKTTLAILEMVSKAVSANDIRIAYVSPTYQQSRDICWLELKKICLPVASNINESRLEITVKTQKGGTSSIWLRGWESIETLRGQKFDFIVIDEVASMRNWYTNWQEVIRPTLTDTKGDALFISTPKGFNHFYDLSRLEATDTDYKSFHFTSFDNPILDPLELEKARMELTEDRFAQEYMADFRKTEGLVYKEFNRDIHLFDDSLVFRSQNRIVGLDWGYTNPAAMTIIERDYDNTYYVTGEYYQRGKTREEIVEYARSLKGNAYYPDTEDPAGIELMRRMGLPVHDVNKDIEAGIDAVRKLFKAGKLRIHKSCINLIQELETYSYPEKKPMHNEPEVPIKENDHLLDSLRYAIFMQSDNPMKKKVHQFVPAFKTYQQSRTSVLQ